MRGRLFNVFWQVGDDGGGDATGATATQGGIAGLGIGGTTGGGAADAAANAAAVGGVSDATAGGIGDSTGTSGFQGSVSGVNGGFGAAPGSTAPGGPGAAPGIGPAGGVGTGVGGIGGPGSSASQGFGGSGGGGGFGVQGTNPLAQNLLSLASQISIPFGELGGAPRSGLGSQAVNAGFGQSGPGSTGALAQASNISTSSLAPALDQLANNFFALLGPTLAGQAIGGPQGNMGFPSAALAHYGGDQYGVSTAPGGEVGQATIAPPPGQQPAPPVAETSPGETAAPAVAANAPAPAAQPVSALADENSVVSSMKNAVAQTPATPTAQTPSPGGPALAQLVQQLLTMLVAA